jgi:DNA-binding transcriptional MerR regulator
MRLSELAEQSGVSVPTIKWYMREGMLSPGEPVGPRKANYTEAHLRRIGLIQALTGPAGLSLAQTRQILQIIDESDTDVTTQLGRAITILASSTERDGESEQVQRSYPRARRVVEWLGAPYRAEPPAAALLEQALESVERAGFQLNPQQFALYGEHMLAIASGEVGSIPDDAEEAVAYAVLGTVLFEPVLTAVRRLAQQCLVRPENP